jgi:streptomycin 6-kinase
MMKIPEVLIREVSVFQNGRYRDWLEELPGIVEDLSSRWNLSLEKTFDYPSISYVVLVRRSDRTRGVLKIGFLHDEISSEIDSLKFFDGRGAARLLTADKTKGALLLEFLDPGVQLAESAGMSDDEKTIVACDLIRKLCRPARSEDGFKTLEDWTSGVEKIRTYFTGGTGPFPAGAVHTARQLRLQLLQLSPKQVLLHADFQHFNILSAGHGPWLVIDPKGVVGDPAFEPSPFLRNCLWDSDDPEKRLSRRLDIFAERLGIDRKRLYEWAMVDSVLSA